MVLGSDARYAVSRVPRVALALWVSQIVRVCGVHATSAIVRKARVWQRHTRSSVARVTHLAGATYSVRSRPRARRIRVATSIIREALVGPHGAHPGAGERLRNALWGATEAGLGGRDRYGTLRAVHDDRAAPCIPASFSDRLGD